MLFSRYRFPGSLLGWFIGTSAGFFVGLFAVQRHGPEKPTDEGAVAVLILGPLILALLLVLVVVL